MNPSRLASLFLFLIPSLAHAQMIPVIWKDTCASCHGNAAAGTDKAKSLLDDSLRWQDTDRRLFDSIRDGTSKAKDHAFGPGSAANLDNAKVWGLVNFLRELQAREARKQTGSSKPSAQGVYTTKHQNFTIDTVVPEGLSIPWSIDFIPSGDFAGMMLITERPGTIKLRTLTDPAAPLLNVIDLPHVRVEGQGGLLDVALHPNYRSNGWIYLSFSDEVKGPKGESLGMTKVVRGHLRKDGDLIRWADQQTIFEAKPEHYLGGGVHFGSKFAFDPKDPTILFFGIGERGSQDFAQDLTRPNGKIHRVKDDGSIPADNPFIATKDAYQSIWSYGHRNPQGLAFDLDGNLWDTEHAPRGGDELNLILKGHNYGWPLVSFGINYSGAAFKTPWPETTSDFPKDGPTIDMPKDRWLPSIATCGLVAVSATPFANWHNDLLAGGLAGQCVDRIRARGGTVIEREEILFGLGRVRDIQNGPDGNIYIVLNAPDKVIRFVPSK